MNSRLNTNPSSNIPEQFAEWSSSHCVCWKLYIGPYFRRYSDTERLVSHCSGFDMCSSQLAGWLSYVLVNHHLFEGYSLQKTSVIIYVDASALSPDIDRISLLESDISNCLVLLQLVAIKYQIDWSIHIDAHLPLIPPHDLLYGGMWMNT